MIAEPLRTENLDDRVAGYLPLVAKLANSWGAVCIAGIERDDYRSAMLYALARLAVRRPDALDRPWYVQAALRNACRDVGRKVLYSSRHEQSHANPILAQSTPDAFDLLMAAVEERTVRRALDSMPSQTGVTMRLWADGWSYQQIAKRLHVPLGTVKQRLNRGRAAVRHLLNEEGINGGAPTENRGECPGIHSGGEAD